VTVCSRFAVYCINWRPWQRRLAVCSRYAVFCINWLGRFTGVTEDGRHAFLSLVIFTRQVVRTLRLPFSVCNELTNNRIIIIPVIVLGFPLTLLEDFHRTPTIKIIFKETCILDYGI